MLVYLADLVLNELKSKFFQSSSLSTYDFSTLYNTLPDSLGHQSPFFISYTGGIKRSVVKTKLKKYADTITEAPHCSLHFAVCL